jgi:hypothetical protein
MHHFVTALFASIVATVVVGGTALTPTSAEAAKMPSPEAAALKEATAACKAEAKENKISWPASRKFVMRRKDRQTHADPTSGDCRKTSDRCLQGGGEGQEDQMARQPEIRQHLPLKRSQGLSA